MIQQEFYDEWTVGSIRLEVEITDSDLLTDKSNDYEEKQLSSKKNPKFAIVNPYGQTLGYIKHEEDNFYLQGVLDTCRDVECSFVCADPDGTFYAYFYFMEQSEPETYNGYD